MIKGTTRDPVAYIEWRRALTDAVNDVRGTYLEVLAYVGARHEHQQSHEVTVATRQLSAATGLSANTVRKYLRRATTEGWLRREVRGGRRWQQDGHPSVYAFTLPDSLRTPIGRDTRTPRSDSSPGGARDQQLDGLAQIEAAPGGGHGVAVTYILGRDPAHAAALAARARASIRVPRHVEAAAARRRATNRETA